MDNSGSHKEGVSRTYKGNDGFAPMAVYIGQEGYCLDFEFREGKQHCQKDTPALLENSLRNARRITKQPQLMRLDGGNDSIEVVIYSLDTTRHWKGYDYQIRQVIRVTERTIDKHGQSLLIPDIRLEGWWTSLELDEQAIIQLYCDHGTSEQFHSEFKTDMDIERLPSGKFAANAVILACSVLIYNILRWIGQIGLIGSRSPKRHKAKRRRIKTVMQDMMNIAVRVVKTTNRIKLSFGKGCCSYEAFNWVYHKLAYG